MGLRELLSQVQSLSLRTGKIRLDFDTRDLASLSLEELQKYRERLLNLVFELNGLIKQKKGSNGR